MIARLPLFGFVLKLLIGSIKIPNYKHQISNKFQITIINDQNFLGKRKTWHLLQIDRFGILNFGHWNLFDIWDLGFDISVLSKL
jgi:hypothetical protein